MAGGLDRSTRWVPTPTTVIRAFDARKRANEHESGHGEATCATMRAKREPCEACEESWSSDTERMRAPRRPQRRPAHPKRSVPRLDQGAERVRVMWPSPHNRSKRTRGGHVDGCESARSVSTSTRLSRARHAREHEFKLNTAYMATGEVQDGSLSFDDCKLSFVPSTRGVTVSYKSSGCEGFNFAGSYQNAATRDRSSGFSQVCSQAHRGGS